MIESSTGMSVSASSDWLSRFVRETSEWPMDKLDGSRESESLDRIDWNDSSLLNGGGSSLIWSINEGSSGRSVGSC